VIHRSTLSSLVTCLKQTLKLMELKLGDQNKPEIFTIQKILKQLELYPFAIDGDFGIGTYKAVYAFQKAHNLKPDGIVGEKTFKKLLEFAQFPSKEFNLSIPTLLDVVNRKNYDLDERLYRVNIIGIRMDDVYDNRFSDKCVLLWKNEKMEWESRTFKWTTMAGTLGTGGVFNPFTVRGKTAVGILKEGYYPQVWQFVDSYKAWLLYPYLYQIGKFDIYRDGNRNDVLERWMPVETSEWDGFNCHRMSSNGIDTDIVNFAWVTWSAGCQGAPEPTFRNVVDLIRISSKLTKKSVFDYMLLHKDDFIVA
jgi:hypothetical protein